jgi:hypothetical protein
MKYQPFIINIYSFKYFFLMFGLVKSSAGSEKLPKIA